jgi:hypothetical protein
VHQFLALGYDRRKPTGGGKEKGGGSAVRISKLVGGAPLLLAGAARNA